MAETTGQSAAANPGADWLTPGRFAAALALLVFAAFPEVLTLQGTFFHRDYGAFGYPLAAYHRECFWRGELPLWNPLNYCGLPFLAQWNTIALYPGTLIYLLLPLPWSVGIYCVAHFYFAGLGMFFLARRWTGNPLAAAVAGVGYTFTGVLLQSLMWQNNIAALGWMPWVVLLVDRASREGGRWTPLAALAGGMQMLTGAPEIILQTWALAGLLLAGVFFGGKEQKLRLVARFGFIVALVAALAAIQLLPFLDLLKHSQRNSSFADSQWAMPWWGWANLFVPLFRTFPGSIGVHAQPGQAWVYSYYPGVAVLFLAVLGAWKIRERRVLLLGGATLLTLWLALGDDGGLYRAVREIFPGIGFMRYPVKFVVMATFCLPLLAAFGAKFLLETENDFAARRKSALTLLGIFSGIIAVLAALGAAFPVNEVPGAVAAWNGAGKIVILALLAGALVWWRRSSSQRMKLFATLTLLFVLWADAMSNGPRANPTVPNWTYEPGLARRELRLEPAPKIGESRAMLTFTNELALNSLSLTDPVDYLLYERLAFTANLNLLDGVPKVSGFYSLYFPEMMHVVFLLFSPANPPSALLDFLGASLITVPGKNIVWERRPGALPWITAGQQPVFRDAASASVALAATNFNPREVVFLTPQARALVTATNLVAARVKPLTFTAQRIEFEVESPQPALAVVSQNFYRNWHPTVNGRPVPLLRANLAFQAVEVPAGRSHVTLVYRERMLAPGAAVSGGALILLLALGWKAWKKSPRTMKADPVIFQH